MNTIPSDVLYNDILGRLGLQGMTRARRVCRAWKNMIDIYSIMAAKT